MKTVLADCVADSHMLSEARPLSQALKVEGLILNKSATGLCSTNHKKERDHKQARTSTQALFNKYRTF